jgi:hypothetical protein
MAAYRRRPNGILEITRPKPASRVRGAISKFAAGLSVTLVPAVALAIYVSLGVPLLLVAGLAAAGALAWLATWGRPKAAPPVKAPTLLLARRDARRGTSPQMDARNP